MMTPARTRVGFDRRSVGVLGALIVAGLSLRWFNLGAKNLWLDELLSLNHARQIAGWTSFLASGFGDAHPPMYFLVLKGWLLLAGGDASARWLSVLFGVAVIPATFVLARQFFSTRLSLLSSLLVAVSPLFLLYDREVRNYSQFTLLSVLSLWFLMRALREGRSASWVGYTTLTVLNIYTHYHAFLLIAGEMAFVALRVSSHRGRLKALLLSLALVGLSYLPMLPTLLKHISFVGSVLTEGGRFPVTLGYWVRPAYIGFALSLGQTLLPWKPLAIAGGAAVLVFLVFAVRTLRFQREAATFLAACFLLPLGLGTLFSDAMPRYYLFLAPLFYIILASGIAAVPRVVVRGILAVVLAVAWGVGLGNYYANRDFHVLAHVDPWREVGQLLRTGVSTGDVVIQVALKPPIEADPLGYALGFPIAIRGEDILADLPRLTANGTAARVWLIVSESTLQQPGLGAATWLSGNYAQCTEHRYRHDPDYSLKKRFFRKDFAEYRIRVYRFAEPHAHVPEPTACQSVLWDQ
jgi:uncharacterized membrane protein